MVKGMNAGFGEPLSVDDIIQMHSMRLGGVRTEIHASMSEGQILEILRPFVGSRLKLLVLLHGESLLGPELAQQALRAMRLAAQLNLSIDLELQNEPDLAGVHPLKMRARMLTAYIALRGAGFGGAILGGSVMNLHKNGRAYFAAMGWKTLPADLSVAVHRYAPHNLPGASHMGSLAAELAEVKRVTGDIPYVTEMGYHTALQTSWWDFHSPYFHPAFTLTNEQAAEGLFEDLQVYAAAGCPRVDVFQWNSAPISDPADFEARYGVRGADGTWNAKGIMLAQVGEL